MKPTSGEDIFEVTFTPVPAWMLMGAGGFFLVLGILFTTPIAHSQQILLGTLIALASACALVGGWYWLKHLPVLVRLTPDELQFPTGKHDTVRWLDIERIEAKQLNPVAHTHSLCIKLKEHAKSRKQSKGGMKKLRALVGADHDVIIDEQELGCGAQWLATQCNQRLSLAVARQHQASEEASLPWAPATAREEQQPTTRVSLEKLGPYEASFGPRSKSKIQALLVLLGAIALGVFLSVLPLLRPPKPGEEAATYAACFTMGGLAVLAGVVATAPALLRARRTVHVHAHGLRVVERGRSRMHLWTDVKALRLREETEAFPNYMVDIVELQDGSHPPIEIDPHKVRDAARLWVLIEDAVCAAQVPSLAARLRSGEQIAFGPLVLTRDGIQAMHTFLPWQAITELHADRKEDCFEVIPQEAVGRICFHLTEVPSVALIRKLLEMFRGN